MQKETITKGKNLLKELVQYSLPFRLAIGMVVTIVTSGGIGFIGEYATYSYAINSGFRPPIEGVPYLKVSITFISIFLLFTGSLIYIAFSLFSTFILESSREILSYLVNFSLNFDFAFKKIALKLSSMLAQNVHKNISDKLPNFAIAMLAVFSSLIVLTLSNAFLLVPTLSSIFNVQKMAKLSELNLPWILASFMFVITILNFRPRWKHPILGVIFIIYCGTAIGFLFNVSVHAKLLRTLGYGGGFFATLVFEEDSSQKRAMVGRLMIRSNDCYVMFDEVSGEFKEIPRDQVKTVLYEKNEVGSINLKLN